MARRLWRPRPWHRRFIANPSGGSTALIDVLTSLGLTTGLQFALDAGDAASYTSGQSWLDRSGNGQDFFLGANGSATSSDPTFNSDGYFAHDGGDYFTYDSSNETWMENLHKDNAVGTLLVWYYPATLGGPQAILATSTQSLANTGFALHNINAGGAVRLTVTNGSGSAAALLTNFASGTLTANTWNFVGFSIDESVGSGGLIGFVSGTASSNDSTYTSPSSGSATATLQIGAANGATIISNGSRTAAAMGWNVALTAVQMDSIFDAMRGRFGV